MSATDDVFGAMPTRPDHPDFWRLSDMILRYDGALEGGTDDDREVKFEAFVAMAEVDLRSLSYLAMQRAFRAYGITVQSQLANPATAKRVMKFAAGYMEAFVMGVRWAEGK